MTLSNHKLKQIYHKITEATAHTGRTLSDITIVAATKTRSIDTIHQLSQFNINHMGENYVQEALNKIKPLTNSPFIWHFIGPIQTNKCRLIAQSFSWVQTVYREKEARLLNQHRPDNLPSLNICLQINISNESTKSGLEPEINKIIKLAKIIQSLPQLKLRGLMAIPAARQSINTQRHTFRLMHNLFNQLQQAEFILDTLSMGNER